MTKNELALKALDDYLKTLTPAQQQTFVQTFADLYGASSKHSFAEFQKKLTPANRQDLANAFVKFRLLKPN